MKCQHCGKNEATMNLRFSINQQNMQVNMCHTCFAEIQNQINSGKMPSFGSEGNHFFQANGGGQARTQTTQNEKHQDNGLLDQLGKNISNEAREGLIDPVIGRDQEVKRVIETLNRRNKNNPVLIGEPGVGKTAIAEGLAVKIVEGDVPVKLLNKEVYLLDVASLVTNTGIRGQFEERMKQLIEELQTRKDVILFIDEIHLLVGAGQQKAHKWMRAIF